MQMTAPPPHPNLNVVTFFIDTFGGKKSLKGPLETGDKRVLLQILTE
jgi:hypothetical protein